MVEYLKMFIILTFCITWRLNILNAQEKEDQLYVFDQNWKGTDIKNARYLLRIKKINDSSWQWDTYNIMGPLIRTEYYKDANGTVAEGEFYFYSAKGKIDSVHNYRNGLAEGEWRYFNDTGRAYLTKEYFKGILQGTTDLIKEDSLRTIEPTGVSKYIFAKVEKESEFPGQGTGWSKYLGSNIKYPERALNNHVQGIVKVQFIVDTQGNVLGPRISQSVEFSLDEEALKLIRESPKWIPAEQNGKKVKSFKLQPISFILE